MGSITCADLQSADYLQLRFLAQASRPLILMFDIGSVSFCVLVNNRAAVLLKELEIAGKPDYIPLPSLQRLSRNLEALPGQNIGITSF